MPPKQSSGDTDSPAASNSKSTGTSWTPINGDYRTSSGPHGSSGLSIEAIDAICKRAVANPRPPINISGLNGRQLNAEMKKRQEESWAILRKWEREKVCGAMRRDPNVCMDYKRKFQEYAEQLSTDLHDMIMEFREHISYVLALRHAFQLYGAMEPKRLALSWEQVAALDETMTHDFQNYKDSLVVEMPEVRGPPPRKGVLVGDCGCGKVDEFLPLPKEMLRDQTEHVVDLTTETETTPSEPTVNGAQTEPVVVDLTIETEITPSEPTVNLGTPQAMAGSRKRRRSVYEVDYDLQQPKPSFYDRMEQAFNSTPEPENSLSGSPGDQDLV